MVCTGAENWDAKSIESREQCIRVVGRWEPECRIRSFGAGGSVRVLLDPAAHSWTMRMLSICSVAMEDAFLQCIQIVSHYAQSARRLIRVLHRAPQEVSTVRERRRSLVMYHTKWAIIHTVALWRWGQRWKWGRIVYSFRMHRWSVRRIAARRDHVHFQIPRCGRVCKTEY